MRNILLCLAFFASLQATAQCLLVEVPLQKRVNSSDLIIEGRVVDKKSFWNTDHTMIYTSNRIEILKIFKGNTSLSYIDILTEGGTVDLNRITVNPSITLSVGEIGIFTCESVKRSKALPAAERGFPRYEVYAGPQGFIKYDLQQQIAVEPFKKYRNIETELYNVLSPARNFIEKKPFSFTQTPEPSMRVQAITGFAPTTVTAGTKTTITITGTAFGATQGSGSVRFRNADDGGATVITPLASQYISWSSTQIVVEVPQNAGTGTIQVVQGSTSTSAQTLTVSYAHLNVDFDPGPGTVAYAVDHVDDNGSGGYTWRMNTGFSANAAANASFTRAFNTWRCNTNVNWTIGANTSINDAVSDGTNIICFDNTAPLSSGILGVCYSYWSGCASGPTIIWYVNELDIIFDEGSNISPLTWEFGPAAPSGSEYDFETVAVHELGHGHQLGHVISPGAIMHYAIGNGTSNRTLSANDLVGGDAIQVNSIVNNVCGPGAMSNYTCSTLPLSVTSINAYKRNNGIQVQWTNPAESDVLIYELEESQDGSQFNSISSFPASANNGRRANYEWFDAQVYPINNYYRIKTTGVSGEVKYSTIVNVKMNTASQLFTVYPNPVKGNSITINFANIPNGTYTVNLYTIAGQQVVSRTINYNGGNTAENINLPTLASGVYSFTLQGEGISERQNIVIGER